MKGRKGRKSKERIQKRERGEERGRGGQESGAVTTDFLFVMAKTVAEETSVDMTIGKKKRVNPFARK